MAIEKLLNELKSRRPRQVLYAELGKHYQGEQVHLAQDLGVDASPISNVFTYINQVCERLEIAVLLTKEEDEKLLSLFKDKEREIKNLRTAYDSLLVQAAGRVKK